MEFLKKKFFLEFLKKKLFFGIFGEKQFFWNFWRKTIFLEFLEKKFFFGIFREKNFFFSKILKKKIFFRKFWNFFFKSVPLFIFHLYFGPERIKRSNKLRFLALFIQKYHYFSAKATSTSEAVLTKPLIRSSPNFDRILVSTIGRLCQIFSSIGACVWSVSW